MTYELISLTGTLMAFMGLFRWVWCLEKEIERLQCDVNDVAQENILSKLRGYGSCPNYKPGDISGGTQDFKADPKNITGY